MFLYNDPKLKPRRKELRHNETKEEKLLWSKLRRKNLKLLAIEYKGGKCQNPECGYNKCVDALEFHHLSNKDFSISNGNTPSWERIKKELDKCILVCANCHREIHDEENKLIPR